MAQKPNKVIACFQERISWVVSNLDPDPAYRRFVYDYNDVFTALEEALERGEFYQGAGQAVPKKRQWQNALRDDNPSPLFLDWIYTLYRDMKPDHFETEKLNDFLKLGEDIQDHRNRWRPAIRYFAENRTKLERVARSFYAGFGNTEEHSLEGIQFPLLTMPGWIRSLPLSLAEDSEKPRLTFPSAAVTFQDRRLEGLNGDYVAYKGALAYATRKIVKPEPQHNGEIFCARSVLTDKDGFVGFEYSLSKYFTYINTCEVLGAELADWVLDAGQNERPPKLPFRGAPKDAFDLDNRAAYPGVNCLCILLNYSDNHPLRRHPGDYFLLHKRDETQLQAQNTVHVVPAGGHQGFSRGAQAVDTAFWRTMVREFAEELFDMEDLYRQPGSWGDFLQYKKVKKIVDVFFGKTNAAAQAYLLGFGLDPVTLKPEVLVTIVVDWKKAKKQWPDVKFKFNWELQTGLKADRCHWEPLSRQALVRQAKGGVLFFEGSDKPLSTLPAGAACMLQTARHYSFLGLP